MSPAGRPLSENPKEYNTRIRMNKTEVEMLEYCSKITGKTKADIIRLGIEMVYDEIKNKNS